MTRSRGPRGNWAETLLDNYPVSGLVSITACCENAHVSTPTVRAHGAEAWLFSFPDFQSRLHQELEETISNPISNMTAGTPMRPEPYSQPPSPTRWVANMRDSLSNISIPDFDRAAAELSNRKKPVYLAGGRITHALADYFFTHLQVIRSGVTLISIDQPQHMAAICSQHAAGQFLVLFDIRRYEQRWRPWRKIAAERGIFIILFTDTWGSPIVKHAKVVFRLNIEVPSAWDSSVMTLLLWRL